MANSSYIISSGVTSKGINLTSGDSMSVEAGGSADNIYISNGASVTVYSSGAITSAKVSSGGFMGIDGGLAFSTYIYAGSVVVSSGAISATSVYKTTKSAGNGDSVVTSSFSAYVKIDSLGGAASTTLGDYTRMDVYGSADSTTVNSGGAFTVYNSATVTNTTAKAGAFINGFNIGSSQTYASGLLIDHATVKQSDAFLYSGQSASATTVESKTMTISSGAVAVSTTINNGTVNFSSGATVSNVKINGGTFNAYSGTVTSDITLAGGQVNISRGNVQGLLVSGGDFRITGGSLQSDIKVLHNGNLLLSNFASASNIINSGYLKVSVYSSSATAFVSGTSNFGIMIVSAYHWSSGTVASARDTVNKDNGILAIGGYEHGSAFAINTENYGSMHIGGCNIGIDRDGDGYVDSNLYISGQGNASKTSNYGKMFVYSGKVNDTVIYSNGSLTVYSSGSKIGTATSTSVLSGGSMWVDGSASLTTVSSGGWISGKGSMTSTTINDGAVFNGFTVLQSQSWKSGVQLVSGVLSNGDTGNLYFGQSGSKLAVAGTLSATYATLNSVTVSSGANVVVSNGTLSDITVQDGGRMEMSGTDNNIAGTLTLASDAVISVKSKSQLNLRLDNRMPTDDYLISDYSKIEGDFSIKVTIDIGMTPGEYKLAKGVSDFTQAVYLLESNGEYYVEDPVTVNAPAIQKDDMTFQLKLTDGKLTLTTTGNNGPSVLDVTADPTTPTNQTVTVTAKFSENTVTKQYSFTGSDNDDDWITVDSTDSVVSVVLDENATVSFRGLDANGNKSKIVSRTVDWIDSATVIVTADITKPTKSDVTLTASYSAAAVTKEYSLDGKKTWQTYTAPVTVTENLTAYFRGRNQTGQEVSWGEYEVTNIDRTPPEKPTITADITTLTNQDVTLTVTYNEPVTSYYSVDGKTTWQVTETGKVVASENGTFWFRGTDAAGNVSPEASYEVTNIDKSAPDKPTVTADITVLTNQNVTLTAVYGEGTVTKQYSLDNKEWKAYPAGGVVMEANGTVYFRGLNELGTPSVVTVYVVENIDKTAPEKPVVTAEPSGPTNQNVTLTAFYSADSAVKEYSQDNGNTWQTYTGAIIMTENGTVWFRAKDSLGNISDVTEFNVTNIDRIPPEKPTVTANITVLTNQDVTLTAVYSTDTALKQYSLDNQEWKTYPAGGVVMNANGTVYFRGVDAAGNNSAVTSYAVTNIDKTVPDKPVVTANPSGPTNQNVALTAEYSRDTALKQYSLDNGNTWQVYSDKVIMENNGTVYFRGVNSLGTPSETVIWEVSNIDRVPPEMPRVSADITEPTEGDVTLTAVYSADTALKQYSLDNLHWDTYRDDVVVSENGTVWFRGLDAAGNISPVASYIVNNIIEVPVSGDPVKVYSSGVLVKSGGILTGETLAANGNNSMFISSGGKANTTQIDAGGKMTVSRGGKAIKTTLNSTGLAHVSSGGTVSRTDINAAGRMNVYSSGLAVSTTLNSNGRMYVMNGGSAFRVFVESAGGLYVNGGKVSGAEINAAGRMYVTSGGTGYDTMVNSKGYLFVSNGGSIDGATVNSAARLQIASGGTAYNIRNSGGEILVQDQSYLSSAAVIDGTVRITAASAAGLSLESGRLYVSSGGIADGVSAGSAARVYVSSGGKLTGRMNFTQETVVQIQSGGTVDFDVAAETPDSIAMVNYLTMFGGTPTYTITVAENQQLGLYTLAAYAIGFNNTMTIGTETAVIGDLTPNGTSCVYNETRYSIAFSNTKLVLSVRSKDDADMDIFVSPDKTEPTNQDVTVTAVYGKDIAVREYSLDYETWQDYTASVVMTENGTVYFRGFDSAMNPSDIVSYEVTNIDKIPPAKPIASADITEPTDQAVTVTAIFDDDSILNEYSLDSVDWNVYSGGIVFTVNGSVFFRSSDAAGNVSEVAEFVVSNIQPAVPDRVAGDLNADGRADIVMTVAQGGHPADGSTGAWLIQNDQTAAWGDLSTRNTGWEIFGTGRTVTDKNTDDVYLKSTDNVIGAWTTDNDGKVTGWETIGEFSADTQIVGLGDFNGNGQTDLLLRNTNGAVGCFFTGGETTGWNYFQSLGDEWKLSAIGDLNGDGRDDVVLKHDAGFAGSWLTQADGTMAWADLDTLPEGFEIVGAGDFDGDGTDDVLLKNGNYYGAWLVNNGNAAGWMGLGDLGSVTVEQITDFNGDGKDDLRIRTSAGDLGAQLVMGEDDLVWKYYGSVGSEWSTGFAALA